jgi:hypothetical protein
MSECALSNQHLLQQHHYEVDAKKKEAKAKTTSRLLFHRSLIHLLVYYHISIIAQVELWKKILVKINIQEQTTEETQRRLIDLDDFYSGADGKIRYLYSKIINSTGIIFLTKNGNMEDDLDNLIYSISRYIYHYTKIKHLFTEIPSNLCMSNEPRFIDKLSEHVWKILWSNDSYIYNLILNGTFPMMMKFKSTSRLWRRLNKQSPTKIMKQLLNIEFDYTREIPEVYFFYLIHLHELIPKVDHPQNQYNFVKSYNILIQKHNKSHENNPLVTLLTI